MGVWTIYLLDNLVIMHVLTGQKTMGFCTGKQMLEIAYYDESYWWTKKRRQISRSLCKPYFREKPLIIYIVIALLMQ